MTIRTHPDARRTRRRYFFVPMQVVMSFMLALGATSIAWAEDQPSMKKDAGLASLITETPEEGFALAVKLSQKAVASTQKDADIRKALRPAYAHNPDSLIAISQVVATHFQTIAAANEYWRK